MEPIVRFKNISKSYNQIKIIEQVSFDLFPSTINVLVGPNGAGKSTIAKILAKIMEYSSGAAEYKKGIKISYVPQKIVLSLDIPVTAEYYAEILGISKFQLIGYFYQTEEDIDKIWGKMLRSLSVGQLQIFMIAVAFAQNPDLIILDEPTSSFDIDAQSKFYEIIEKVRQSKNTTIFMISHDLHSVIGSADQVLCINHHICCSGKPFKNNDTLEANIGVYQHRHDHNHSEIEGFVSKAGK